MPAMLYSEQAKDDIARLDPAVKERVRNRVEALAASATEGKPLRNVLRGVFSLRMGDWRILYRRAGNDTLQIIAVRHRRSVYQ